MIAKIAEAYASYGWLILSVASFPIGLFLGMRRMHKTFLAYMLFALATSTILLFIHWNSVQQH